MESLWASEMASLIFSLQQQGLSESPLKGVEVLHLCDSNCAITWLSLKANTLEIVDNIKNQYRPKRTESEIWTCGLLQSGISLNNHNNHF